MTKKIVLSAIAASVMATSAFATYGATMLSYGAKDKAMGGTGIASANGAQSAILNPAMIAGAEEEVSANLTYMLIDVTADSNNTQGAKSSATDTSMVPTITYVKPINKELTVGLNIYGAAGMGADYSAEAAMANIVTELQILKIAVPVAYKTGALAVGITPVFASGSLAIKHSGGAKPDNEATDTAFSYELGAAYEVNKELTVGLAYKAPISMTYEGVIVPAATNFGVTGITDELEQPAEMGLGVSYKMGTSTINFDYKTIAWSSAAGYGDFNWEDQSIIAFGYEYNAGSWTARAGYSMSDTPMIDGNTDQPNDDRIDALNAFGFPAIIASHMTFGGSYNVSKKMILEAAVVLATGEDYSVLAPQAGSSTITATNDQTNITIGLNYKY